MAWLDNSPVLRDEANRVRFVERGLNYINRKLRLLTQLPPLKILSQYLQYFFARKKINALELTIQRQTFDDESTTSYVLRELLQIKKNYQHVLSKNLPSAAKLAMLRANVLDKAHIAYTKADVISTHKHVMSLLTRKPPAPDQKPPVRLHWRHADYHFPIQQPTNTIFHSNMVFVHGSLARLLQLLTQPSDELVQNSLDLRVSRQELVNAAQTNDQLVASLALKYTPNFTIKPNSQPFGFWQQPRQHQQPLIKFDKSLLSKIEHMFFLNSHQHDQFKKMVASTQNTTLIELLSKLEMQKQIALQAEASNSLASLTP